MTEFCKEEQVTFNRLNMIREIFIPNMKQILSNLNMSISSIIKKNRIFFLIFRYILVCLDEIIDDWLYFV